MKTLFSIAAGMALGIAASALVVFLKRSPSAEERALAPIQGAVEEKLRVEYEKAQDEIKLLKKLLAVLGSGQKAAPGNSGSLPAKAGVSPHRDDEAPEPSQEERRTSVREALELLEKNAKLKEIYQRFSKEEGAYPNWTSSRFLQDPGIHPDGSTLSDRDRRRFEILYARAFERLKALDLKRQLYLAEAAARKLDDLLEGAPPASGPIGSSGQGLSVSLPDNLQVILPSGAAEEIQLLEDEKTAAVVEWLVEAQKFFTSSN
ncbi:MAG: hypothetical protein HY717_11845 [Planctomycetes bacterium]|nr:hypothetical protein [Planctomycetota bacterium]